MENSRISAANEAHICDVVCVHVCVCVGMYTQERDNVTEICGKTGEILLVSEKR